MMPHRTAHQPAEVFQPASHPDPQVSIRLSSWVSPRIGDRHSLSHWFYCVTVSPSPAHPTHKSKRAESTARFAYVREAGDRVTRQEPIKYSVILMGWLSPAPSPCHQPKQGRFGCPALPRGAARRSTAASGTETGVFDLALHLFEGIPASARQSESAELGSPQRGEGEAAGRHIFAGDRRSLRCGSIASEPRRAVLIAGKRRVPPPNDRITIIHISILLYNISSFPPPTPL
jgi:hypothetical protein